MIKQKSRVQSARLQGHAREIRDGGLISNKSGVSLTILSREGVSGSLGHRISDQWPRTDLAGERAGAGAGVDAN